MDGKISICVVDALELLRVFHQVRANDEVSGDLVVLH